MPRFTSRFISLTLVLLIGTLAPSRASAELADIQAQAVATGFGNAVAVTHTGDARLFIATLGGRIMIFEGGQTRADAFLDIGNQIFGQGFGLYGLAFHPNFAANGFFFIHYTGQTGELIVARYQVSGDDPNRADPASEKILLSIPKEQILHYGGQLAFGPDGYLYISTGDGTGQGRVIDPQCAALSLDSLEGKILRLDVDQSVDAAPYFTVPDDNPFVGGAGRPEVWAYGLRNPWRFSFDRATGDLWITDVGQDRREEINLQSAASLGGQNYGWKIMEGTFCFDNRVGCPASVPPCDDPSFTAPTIQYSHSEGRCAAIGGSVYRGALADLAGRYLYGDYCTGEVWAARNNGGNWVSDPLTLDLPPVSLTSIAEDAAGEIWMTAGDTLYRLVGPNTGGGEECAADATHLCLNQGRFEVSVTWRTATEAGSGRAVGLGEDAGSFWFFSANNPEIFVKVLDACADPFNHFWVFAAGLTDVETSLMVKDTQTGETRRYDRPLGASYEAVRDTSAFATCP